MRRRNKFVPKYLGYIQESGSCENKTAKRNIKFIHVGKCGGTYLNYSFRGGTKLYRWSQTHMIKAKFNPKWEYVIWIRNPLSRFVSAFNYHYYPTIADLTPFKGMHRQDLDVTMVVAPGAIARRLKNGWAFGEFIDNLYGSFKTPNALAEALSSTNVTQKENALRLMKQRNLSSGFSFYLHQGDFIKKHHKDVLLVGSVERMSSDVRKLCKLLKAKMPSSKKRRENKSSLLSTKLSPKAISNLKKHYALDFHCLKIMRDYKLIDKELWESYQTYSNE